MRVLETKVGLNQAMGKQNKHKLRKASNQVRIDDYDDIVVIRNV